MNKEHQKSLETFCIECEMGEGRLHNQRKFAKDLRQLLNDNAALRAALKFYADRDNYTLTGPWALAKVPKSPVMGDGGHQARAALEGGAK